MKDRSASLASRLLLALWWFGVCFVGIWFAFRVGYSRMLARYASVTRNPVAANRAVELTPLDPQAHSARALVLYNNGSAAEAATELEIAASLRPRDDYLWLRLGLLRDELHHPEALLAFQEAVRRAPYYGHPRWLRGNYLLRSGRYDEAFADLRFAAASDQTLIPNLIDLAWGVSRQNPELTKQWAGIDDDRMRIAFARFLASHGHGPEALVQFRESHVVSLQARKDLIADFLSSNSFREAFEIWRGMGSTRDRFTAIHDGDFETERSFDDSGFGWRFAQSSPGARMSLAIAQPSLGKQSLRVTFLGYSEPNATLLSQLILVEPLKHYRVTFSGRAENLVTGGPPILSVTKATGDKRIMGQSLPIGLESSAWQSFEFDFQTDDGSEAVELRLQRKPCKDTPCPIFGTLWLDNFSIDEVR